MDQAGGGGHDAACEAGECNLPERAQRDRGQRGILQQFWRAQGFKRRLVETFKVSRDWRAPTVVRAFNEISSAVIAPC